MSRDLDGIVVHVTTADADGWRQALRNLSNLYDDESIPIPPDMIAVVANGGAVRFLRAGVPEADRLTRMTDAGVRIAACARSLERLGYPPEDLADGVGTVSSGVAEVVKLQWAGHGYLKLP